MKREVPDTPFIHAIIFAQLHRDEDAQDPKVVVFPSGILWILGFFNGPENIIKALDTIQRRFMQKAEAWDKECAKVV